MRNRFNVMLLAVVVLTALSSCRVAVCNAGPITDSALAETGLTRYWTANVPFLAGDRVDAAYLVDDTVYVLSRDGFLFSLQADTGLIRWGTKLGARDSRIAKPIHFLAEKGKGPTGVLAGEGFYVFDRYSGDLLFHASDALNLGGLIVGAERSVFVGSASGRVYSYKLLGSGRGTVLKRWELALNSRVTAAPLLFGDRNVLFATHSGLLVACSALDKAFRWSFRASGPFYGDPTVNESGVYASSMDRSLYKLDGVSGRLVWRARFPCELADGPVATVTNVYQYCGLSGLYSVSAISGKILWNVASGSAFVAEVPGRVAVRTHDGQLLIVDNRSGAVLADFDVDDGAVLATNSVNAAIYLAKGDGRIVCIRPADTPYLTGSKAVAARNRLTAPPESAGNGSAQSEGEPPSASKEDDSDPDILRSRRDKNKP